MKQTAVEWLIQKYINGVFINIQEMKEALEMEKEQMKNSFFAGDDAVFHGINDKIYKSFEQYYNETFKSE